MYYGFEIRIVSSDYAIIEANSEKEARELAKEWHNWKNQSCDTWEELDVQELIAKGKKLGRGSCGQIEIQDNLSAAEQTRAARVHGIVTG